MRRNNFSLKIQTSVIDTSYRISAHNLEILIYTFNELSKNSWAYQKRSYLLKQSI